MPPKQFSYLYIIFMKFQFYMLDEGICAILGGVLQIIVLCVYSFCFRFCKLLWIHNYYCLSGGGIKQQLCSLSIAYTVSNSAKHKFSKQLF